jgi:ubiquinone/menaquinone biosynthesis C-methylase UbiE
MKIEELLRRQEKPALYAPGTAVMWTDEHISRQLLAVHLDQNTHLASRKTPVIEKTVALVLSRREGKSLDILDLGCGPGLYTERFAREGHRVTGVDFSENSLNYARKSAEGKGLALTYVQGNYLQLELPEQSFDLVTMIYEDYAVLNPEERAVLLRRIAGVLRKGGVFFFDYPNDRHFEERISPPSWECSPSGFWRDTPYLSLSRSFVYGEEKVILVEHLVFDDTRGWEIYRFWHTFFPRERIEKELGESGFRVESLHEDILPGESVWTGDNVTFAFCRKV